MVLSTPSVTLYIREAFSLSLAQVCVRICGNFRSTESEEEEQEDGEETRATCHLTSLELRSETEPLCCLSREYLR